MSKMLQDAGFATFEESRLKWRFLPSRAINKLMSRTLMKCSTQVVGYETIKFVTSHLLSEVVLICGDANGPLANGRKIRVTFFPFS